jgi:hypothetical protein
MCTNISSLDNRKDFTPSKATTAAFSYPEGLRENILHYFPAANKGTTKINKIQGFHSEDMH